MKQHLLFILLVCTTFSFAQAQSDTSRRWITGRLTDDKNAPIAYANVALLQSADKALVATALSDKEGVFSIPVATAGNYVLRISAIGFIEKLTPAFAFNPGDTTHNLGTIQLSVDAKLLKEVSITSLRPTIVQLADRMVVSVEGTAMAAGNTAYSVMAKAPGVFIDPEGGIQLNGRSGVLVMLDGRRSFLSGADLRRLLEGMPAENLKNIEIITNPSAKYDAEGTSGILNINLKKNTQQGINGNVYAGYNYNGKQHGYSAGTGINHKSGRWNSFLNADFARRAGGREATFTRVFYDANKATYFNQFATSDWSNMGPPSLRTGTDFSFNDQHSIGAVFSYTKNTGHSNFLTQTFIGGEPEKPSRFIEANNYSNNTYQNYTTNFHYIGKLDTLGTALSADLDYVRIINRGEADFYNYFTNISTSEKVQDFLYTYTPNGYDIYSARIDYTHAFNKVSKAEIGAKASQVIADNDFRFYFNNNGLVPDNRRTNHFHYKENIYAGYLNWSTTLNPTFKLQAGLRAEYTESLGNNYTSQRVTPNDYLNLFPSLFLQQKVTEQYGINYSYSRRLTRPNYGNLNPFRSYRDPYTYTEGNPYLRPQYTNSFSITQTFKKVYNLTLSYMRNKDVMAELPILHVQDTTTVYTTGNVDDGYSAGATAVAPLKITRWWDSQNTLVCTYNSFSMQSNNSVLTNDQLFVMLQSNHTLQLPKKVRMELNILLRGPAASGLYQMAPMHRVDVAFKRSFIKQKLDLSINASDLFKTYRFRWSTNIAGNVNDFDQYMRWRNVGLTLRYNFSKGQKVEVKRRNAVEELNRT